MQKNPPSPPRKLICARCAATFECGLGTDCWCAAVPYALPMPASPADDCLCPACLRKAAEDLAAEDLAAEALAGKAGPRL